MAANRNGFVEIIRLTLALMIAAMHFNGSVPGAYLGLEFFFMISGFYQMQRMSRDNFSPFTYTIVRFLKLIFIYEVSILFSCLMGGNGIDISLFFRRMFICLPDMLCLQMTGLANVRINPELWYVSAMMTAGLFLALLHSINSRSFYYLLPIIAIISYSFLYQRYCSLGVNHLVRDFFFPSGTIRALAGMSVGCLLYPLSEAVKKINPSRSKSILLTLLFFFAIAVCAICFAKVVSVYDFYVVFCASAILLCAASGELLFSNFLDRLGNKINAILGKQFSFGIVAFSDFVLLSGAMIIPYEKFPSWVSLVIFLTILSIISVVGAKAAELFNRKYLYRIIEKVNSFPSTIK